MDSTPRWIGDLKRLLPIRSQFVVAGNIRDSFLTPYEQGTTLAPLLRCLWAHLAPLDYRFLLVFDPVEGLRSYPNEPAVVELATKLFDLKPVDGVMPMSLENLIGVMRKVAGQRDARCALVIDFASRLTRQAVGALREVLREFGTRLVRPLVVAGEQVAQVNGRREARFVVRQRQGQHRHARGIECQP